jgi:hypothetical protein
LFLLFWNRAHLTPHSYSLLVDINNRPTLYFSFLLLLFFFPVSRVGLPCCFSPFFSPLSSNVWCRVDDDESIYLLICLYIYI